MKVEKNINYIFDFDGTVVDLNVDWKSLKEEVNSMCQNFGIDTAQKLNIKIDLLKEQRTDITDLLQRFEQVDKKVSYTVKLKTIELINTLDEFYIVSNNLNSTVKKVLNELNLIDKCIIIVGIDDIEKSKPSNESFFRLKEFLKYEDSLYIGDRETDKEFAESCNIKFKNMKEI